MISTPVIVSTTTEACIFQFPTFGDTYVRLVQSGVGPSFDWPASTLTDTDGSIYDFVGDVPAESRPFALDGDSGTLQYNSTQIATILETDYNNPHIKLNPNTTNRRIRFQVIGTGDPSGYIDYPTFETTGTSYATMNLLKIPPKFRRLDSFSLPLSYRAYTNDDANSNWSLGLIDGGSYGANTGSPDGWVVDFNESTGMFDVEISPNARPGVYRASATRESTSHGHNHVNTVVFEVMCMTATITIAPTGV